MRSDNSLSVPKWLKDPILGASSHNLAYGAATVTMGNESEKTVDVKLFHSGWNLYVCFTGLPSQLVQEVVILATSREDASDFVKPGDYEFGVVNNGVLKSAGVGPNGDFVPLSVPCEDFAAVVSYRSDQSWDAELRISLEWLGGYSRTDRFMLMLLGTDRNLWGQWPQSAQLHAPGTWGNLVLLPTYSKSVKAGSAFLDGHGGYLVVPYSPALNPAEITIEAWVRVAEGGFGTLIGNGQSQSYWLAINEVVEFSHKNEGSKVKGQISLNDGWHHIAATMSEAGEIVLYVDGEIDVAIGWQKGNESGLLKKMDQRRQLGSSNRMLRIGSDRDVDRRHYSMHGYVRDIRIWNCVRSVQDIRLGAFNRLNGNEPNLVGFWPFTDGLQDVAGSHHAGLLGSASLAHESPNVSSFVPPSLQPPLDTSVAETILSWDGYIPMSSSQITVDGVGRPDEYRQAATLRTEPDKQVAIHMVINRNALYLATYMLMAEPGPQNVLTMWINTTGQGGQTPDVVDKRLRLTRDGTLDAKVGDGSGFTSTSYEALISRASSSEVTSSLNPTGITAQWWSAELRIPFDFLTPFAPGQPLRLAVQYEEAILTQDRKLLVRRWPSIFDENRPDTWGLVSTAGIEMVSSDQMSEPTLPVTDNVVTQGLTNPTFSLRNSREGVSEKP